MGRVRALSCEEMGFGVAMEQLTLLRTLCGAGEWLHRLRSYVDETASKLLVALEALKSAVASEARNPGASVNTGTLREQLRDVFAVVALLGGTLDGLRPGSVAAYRGTGVAQECVVVAFAWPPNCEDADEATKTVWSFLTKYGDACIISLSSDPSHWLTVPAAEVLAVTEPQSDALQSFVAANTQSVMTIFREILLLDARDPRPTYLPIVEEKDMELIFESSHPYPHAADLFTEVSMPGAQEITIQFDEQSRTEPNCDYVKFYKDSTKSDVWGASTYSGREGTQDWPGTGGRDVLKIPAETFM